MVYIMGMAQGAPFVRIVCSGDQPCVVDALHLRSRSRYNNGEPAASVTLQPLDGIVLRRAAWQLYLPFVRK